MKQDKKGSYAFIDSQNLNVTVQNYGWKMDWRKFRKFLTDRYGVSRAFMFIGYMPENEEMYEFLHEAGYAVVLKPTFDLTRPRVEEKPADKTPEKEEKKVKGNVDAELVLWAVKEIQNYDKAIVVTGDGDFYSLVEYLEEHGKLLKLLTPSGHYSRLFNRFDSYIERLDKHRNHLAYKRVARKPKTT